MPNPAWVQILMRSCIELQGYRFSGWIKSIFTKIPDKAVVPGTIAVDCLLTLHK